MKRDLEKSLLRWKEQKGRMPLLVRGARQVGKSYLIENWGKAHFKYFVTLNFEQYPKYKSCFDTLDPKKIVATIELITGVPLEEGSSLLFLDEIQDCPQAITSLRYFKEQLPNLHVIGAGSLLEFVLNGADFKMPVGRIEFLYLRPFSFGEYLEALGKGNLRSYLQSIRYGDIVEKATHEHLLSLVKEYIALGGMPAVIAEFLASKKLLRCQEIQTAILTTFRNDFGKYAKRTPHEKLQMIFSKAPGLIGQWIKYTKLDPDTQSRVLKEALEKLCLAGLIILIYATSGVGLPFVTHMNEKKFKLLFLDIGLVKRACHLDLEIAFKEDIFLVNDGALAEQFVGQELLAYHGQEEMNNLFFWNREQKSSSAEVDYLIAIDSHIVPIEVKAGSIGTLRSLKLFLEEHQTPFGVRISEVPFSFTSQVLNLPFYLIEELPRLVKELWNGEFQ